MKRFLVLYCTVIIAVPLAWVVGEHHHDSCVRAGRVACSVLPWNDGAPKPAAKPLTPAEQAVQCDENSPDIGRCELNEILRK